MACIPDDELQRLEQTVALERLEESRESRDRAQAPRRDLGSGYSEFDLESECVDGKKAIVHVEGVGPGVGAGIPKLPVIASETRGGISFEDYLNSINPDVFNGGFGAFSIGVQIGKLGLGYGKIRLGDAFSRETFQVRGLDVGITLVMGSSTVRSVKWEDCACERQ